MHSWVGLKLSVFMFFVLATGTLAVFAHEIDWLLNADMRVRPSEQRASWAEMLSNVREDYPAWRVDYLRASVEPWFAAEAVISAADGEQRRVYVDPYSGDVKGDAPWFNAQRFLRQAHRHLMLPIAWGVPIVCTMAVVLLLSFGTSLVIYKRWWRGWLRWPRRGDARRFWGDLHRLCGLWTMPFLLLIALTGIWYLVEELGGEAPPLIGTVEPAEESSPAVGAAELIARGNEIFPRLEIRNLIPSGPAGAFVLQGDAGAWLVRPRANTVLLDAGDGTVLARLDARDLSVHQRISEAADPLHFGTFGGMLTKSLWFLFGLAMSAMSATGVYLYGLRVLKTRGRMNSTLQNTSKGRSDSTLRPSPARSGRRRWRAAWRGMHAWRYVGLALVGLVLLLSVPSALNRLPW
ncbi:MAG: PepSY-associated TM helix domain-containing protein [Gammaproteobacteria bacterium]